MLLVIFGPPAVGKMSVGRAVCARSDFRLFHNHHTIEPLIEVFGYGTPAFNALNGEFRIRVMEEAARHGVDLVFTFVWALELAEDRAAVERFLAPFEEAGREVAFVELAADLETRLARNRGEERLAHKPSKRDLAWSNANVRELEEHVLNTGGARTLAEELLERHPWLRLDTAGRSVSETADQVVAWLEGTADRALL